MCRNLDPFQHDAATNLQSFKVGESRNIEVKIFVCVMLKSVKYNSFKFWHAVMSNRNLRWCGKKSYPPQPKHKPSLPSLAYWKWAQRDRMTATTMGVTKLSISSSRKANYKMDYQRWRLMLSPANHNDRPKLERLRAWESQCRRSPLWTGEEKSSLNFVPHGNKIDW